MKVSQFSPVAALLSLTLASPTPTIPKAFTPALAKRASITDACDVGFGTGTTGGAGGSTTTVSSLSQFSSAAESKDPMVIVVKGAISGSAKIRVKSDKTIVGASGSSLTGVGLYVNKQSNVIIRNMKIAKVPKDNGDAIGIQKSSRVWVDHCDLSSDLNSGKDFYDGLLDITHASTQVTVSNTKFHDHFKASLVGHSDSNAKEDKGSLTITYANNLWSNVNSRAPSVRFGTVHVFNNVYDTVSTSGVNTRMGAQVLVESTVFSNTKRAITTLDSKEDGFAVVNDVDLGGSDNTAPKGTISGRDLPYSYNLLGSGRVKAAVASSAGQTLSF